MFWGLWKLHTAYANNMTAQEHPEQIKMKIHPAQQCLQEWPGLDVKARNRTSISWYSVSTPTSIKINRLGIEKKKKMEKVV